MADIKKDPGELLDEYLYKVLDKARELQREVLNQDGVEYEAGDDVTSHLDLSAIDIHLIARVAECLDVEADFRVRDGGEAEDYEPPELDGPEDDDELHRPAA